MTRARLFMAWFGLTAAACGAPTPSDELPRAVHPSERRIRLAVADAARPSVALVDLEDRAVLAPVDVGAPSKLAETERREHALLLQTEPPRVQALWGGVSALEHSEGTATPHVHVYKFEPELVAIAGAELERPEAAWARDGVVALLSATSRGARADWFLESGLEPSGDRGLRSLEVPLREPTGVLALAGGWLVSGADERGSGVLMRLDADGAPVEQAPCEAPFGLLAASAFAALSCVQELVRIRQVAPEAPWSVERSTIAESIPPLVVTGYAALDTLLVRDARGAAWAHDAAGLRALALPAGSCELALEPARGDVAVALGSDGVLRRVSLSSGAVEASLRVTPAFACDSPIRPQLVLAPERAFVSDPAAGLVHDVSLAPLEELRSYVVTGQPMYLAVLGLDPRTRNLGLGDGLD